MKHANPALASSSEASASKSYYGTASMRKLADRKARVDIFFSPKGRKPVCNERCKHCYFFEKYALEENAIPAAGVPGVMASFKEDGYGFYLITSELLLAKNWKELVKISGDAYLNTNGRKIAKEGQPLLEEISQAGVRELVITANISPSHSRLELTKKAIVGAAFEQIKRFNLANPAKALNPVATIIITSENFNKVKEMCSYAYDVYAAKVAKIAALVPFSKSLAELSPNLQQLSVAISDIWKARQDYPPGKFYIQRSGTLGTQGLSKKKKGAICPAGKSVFAIHSMEDGAGITPCIYLPNLRIGAMNSGKMVFDVKAYSGFLTLKEKALNAGYCPAHAVGNGAL